MKISRLIFRKITKMLSSKNIYLTKSLNYRIKDQALPINYDYIRYSTLGLCYEEIINSNIKGCVAELGVYKGDFARRLNLLFNDRKLFLFDTFEGFDNKEIESEINRGYVKENQVFSDTSSDFVLSKMPHPQNCIIKKGVFPNTTIGIEESFCFVSIDADLHDPISEGLNFFYPRLEIGGYIFIHDFNNEQYKGARQAVINFCNKNKISYVPIPDSGGTVIISK